MSYLLQVMYFLHLWGGVLYCQQYFLSHILIGTKESSDLFDMFVHLPCQVIDIN